VDGVAVPEVAAVEAESLAAIVEEAPQPAAYVGAEEMPPVVAKGPPPLPTSAFVSAAAALPPGPPVPQPPPGQSATAMPADARAERRFPRPEIAEVPSAPERKAGPAPVAAAAPQPVAKAAPAKVPAKGARAKKKTAPKVMRASRTDGSHSQLDVGGFMAGFALSGAIGVVLYFVMTAS
jgi:Meckel syndrome type 1 protein